MTMTHMERRLTRVETQWAPDEARLVWAEVDGALPRQQARARLAVCHRLDVDPHDARVMDAMSWLGGDDPALVTQDVETIARWRRQQGIPAEAGEARQRLKGQLEGITKEDVLAQNRVINQLFGVAA